MDLDIRRVWRCPECGRIDRTAGTATSRRCTCRPEPVWMTLVEEPRPALSERTRQLIEELHQRPDPARRPRGASTTDASGDFPNSESDAGRSGKKKRKRNRNRTEPDGSEPAAETRSRGADAPASLPGATDAVSDGVSELEIAPHRPLAPPDAAPGPLTETSTSEQPAGAQVVTDAVSTAVITTSDAPPADEVLTVPGPQAPAEEPRRGKRKRRRRKPRGEKRESTPENSSTAPSSAAESAPGSASSYEESSQPPAARPPAGSDSASPSEDGFGAGL